MIKSDVRLEIPEPTLQTWQEIVDILAGVFAIPAALIMRMNAPDIEVFVSSQSEGNPYQPGDKEHFLGSGLYCETVINSGNRLLVPDALADPDWKDNPDVKLNMISYLGYPLLQPDGHPFGTICVLDSKANGYSPVFEEMLAKFRHLVQTDIELIYVNQTLGDKNQRLTDYLRELQALRGMVPICSSCKAIRDDQGQWRAIETMLVKHPDADFSHGICEGCAQKLYPEFLNK